MDLWKSWNIVRRRAWIVVLCAVGCFFFLNIKPEIVNPPPPSYVSTAKLLLNPPRAVNLGEVTSMAPPTNWIANLTILSELMLGQELLERVVRRARVNTSWTNLRGAIELKSLAENGNQITLLQINLTWSDPKTARLLTRTLCDEFIDYVQEISAKEYASTRKFLESLVAEARAKLAPAEAELLAWRKNHRVLDAGQAVSERTQALARLQSRYASAVEQITKLKGETADLKAFMSNPDSPPPWIILNRKSDAVTALQERLAQARLKLADVERVYEPGTQVVRLQRQAVQEANDLLRREVGSYVASLLQARETELRSAQTQAAAAHKALEGARETESLARNQLEYARLERQIATWDRNYQALLADLYRARVAEQSGSRQGAMSIIQQAEDGTRVAVPAPRDSRRSTPVAVVFSIFFGLAAAFAVEYLFTSMHVRTRIEETLGVPVVGVIPRLPREFVDEWDAIKARTKRGRGEPNPRKPSQKV